MDEIPGYEHEEFTHLAVAAAIISARATCGLGIKAAALALNLDFVPLYHEQYDLIIPEEHFNSDLMQPLLWLMNDTEFRKSVEKLPGYDISSMGSLIAEI